MSSLASEAINYVSFVWRKQLGNCSFLRVGNFFIFIFKVVDVSKIDMRNCEISFSYLDLNYLASFALKLIGFS